MHIINKIFFEFEKMNIKYCHFKSNQHLDESFNGFSDFDILVDYRSKMEGNIILVENRCKRFEPPFIGQYPGVENWLVYDEGDGKIYHIHLHYQLATGKKLFKDYLLPWNELILETALNDSDWRIKVADPNIEILVLLTRISLKSSVHDKIQSYVGCYKLSNDLLKEYTYLKNLIQKDRVRCFANKMFSSEAAKNLTDFILNNDDLNSQSFILINKIIKNELKLYQRYNEVRSLINSNILRLIDLKNKFLSRKLNKLEITKKITTSGGKIIVFIGVDGSGKSTLSQEIYIWLSRKIECKNFYMGEGDGKKNTFATITKLVNKKINSINSNIRVKSKGEPSKKISIWKNPKNYIKKFIHALVIYSIVKDNHKKIIKMQRYKLNGGFSVLDRYPQLQHSNMNDGLKLRKYSNLLDSRLISKLAEKEEKLMQIVNCIHPDIVFRLNISPELAMLRKPEEHFNEEAIRVKANAVNSLEFKRSILIEVDAEKNLNEVISFVKQNIWENI